MNRNNTVSPECFHGLCSSCNYPSCACECHMEEFCSAGDEGYPAEDYDDD